MAGPLNRVSHLCLRHMTVVLFPKYLQLCGLGGNFSLEISWRDILESDKEVVCVEVDGVCGV